MRKIWQGIDTGKDFLSKTPEIQLVNTPAQQSKTSFNETERARNRMGNILANDTSDTRLITRIYNNFKKLKHSKQIFSFQLESLFSTNKEEIKEEYC